MSKKLHIVSLDVPFPADYGGVIDIFYRIKALHSLGYEITLHCFEYGRGAEPELEKYCSAVHYYRREKKLKHWFSRTPFIVKTRSSMQLLENLLKDNSPILFEGMHTTFLLSNTQLKNRIKLVRMHNIEHTYYAELAQKSSGAKKYYFQSEARKLKRYESILIHATHVLAIQENDLAYLAKIHPSVHLLPASMPELEEMEHEETKPYCLFHGNLSVPENESAVEWILENVAGKIDMELIVAGKRPSKGLVDCCNEKKVILVVNPSSEEMEALVTEARVHVLYTDQPTGLKLKLLNALQTCGFVVLNDKMCEGTALAAYCEIANTGAEFIKSIGEKEGVQLSLEAFNARKQFLETHYSTIKNVRLFDELIND